MNQGFDPLSHSIAKETATLSTSLPISKASSIFVRADENRVDRMRAMISGPEGTPYAFGLWLFDVSYPVEYPNVPPVLKNLTTGNGTVRFNPNLYNEGKVCLSLLGTWSGSPEEMWRPGRSTILQVFISISSMIFVDLPYFNEPGYGAPNANNAQSQQYNYNIRRETIRWAVTEQLRRPPRGFEQVVQNHFRLLKSEVLAVATQWAEDDPGTNAYGVPNGGFPLAQSSTRGRGRGGKSRGRGRGNTNGSSSGSATPTPTEPSNGDKGKGVAEQPVYKGGWDVILRDLRAELEKL
ncbi:UBC-like protein [Gonapodya prolifera JEL478]|uniref:UBC-like protein n=1 Tax=Gonapodya prolifera (strain JEL478) TaxID=1344416 RepID=A0A138ZY35_GONPJ|nr:UBC-like protein [Gonapodya prolifera JEL478]|eukprot:KXS09406.1 UBC-like protein [Gonapodya prolifera JEL478]